MVSCWTAGRVFAPGAVIENGAIISDDVGVIRYAGAQSAAPAAAGELFSYPDFMIAPGLIDVHTHGGYGITFGKLDSLVDDLHAYSAWVARTGVTRFLCTLAAPDAVQLHSAVGAYVAAFKQGGFPGAVPAGLHLEGPYLNPQRRGTFSVSWLRAPALAEIAALLAAGEGWIRQVTLAPELPGAGDVVRLLQASGVTVSLGHSDADFAAASEALRTGFTHVTHAFNAQRGFHHREPGVLGAVLASDEATAELIADTVHVHPGAMTVLLRCLGTERVVLVTDAMAAAGLGDGEYTLVGHPVTVKNGVAQEANGTIAGSTATLNMCVRNVHRLLGVPLEAAVAMASRNPARAVGLSATLGELAPGKQADLIIMDRDGAVLTTVVAGRIVYQAGDRS